MDFKYISSKYLLYKFRSAKNDLKHVQIKVTVTNFIAIFVIWTVFVFSMKMYFFQFTTGDPELEIIQFSNAPTPYKSFFLPQQYDFRFFVYEQKLFTKDIKVTGDGTETKFHSSETSAESHIHDMLISNKTGNLVEKTEDADIIFLPLFLSCSVHHVDILGTSASARQAFTERKCSRSFLNQSIVSVMESESFKNSQKKPHVVLLPWKLSIISFVESILSKKSEVVPIFWTSNGAISCTSRGKLTKHVSIPWKGPFTDEVEQSINFNRGSLLTFATDFFIDELQNSRGIGQYIWSLNQLNGEHVSQMTTDRLGRSLVDANSSMIGSKFCIMLENEDISFQITRSILAGCVPVMVESTSVIPFQRTIPFSSYGVHVSVRDIPFLHDILNSVIVSGKFDTLAVNVKNLNAFFQWSSNSEQILRQLISETLQVITNPYGISHKQMHTATVLSPYSITPISMIFSTFLEERSNHIQKSTIWEQRKLSVCIFLPGLHDVDNAMQENIISVYNEESYESVIQQVFVFSRHDKVPYFPTNTSTVHVSSVSEFLNTCTSNSLTSHILTYVGHTKHAYSKSELHTFLKKLSPQPFRALGSVGMVSNESKDKLKGVFIDGMVFHKKWLLAASFAAAVSPHSFNTPLCLSLSMTGIMFSVTKSAPFLSNEYMILSYPEEYFSTCQRKLSENVQLLSYPVFQYELIRDSKGYISSDMLRTIEAGSLGTDSGTSSTELDSYLINESFNQNAGDQCVCSQEVNEVFLPLHCDCSCPSENEKNRVLDDIRVKTTASVLLMSSRVSGARRNILEKIILSYLLSKLYKKMVTQVILVWNGKYIHQAPFYGDRFMKDRGYRIVHGKSNSMNNRWFLELNTLKNHAVLVQDDDLMASPNAIAVLLKHWEIRSGTQYITGFARHYSHANGIVAYNTREAFNEYTIGLPRIGILSKSFLTIYQRLPKYLHSYIDSDRGECDDVLFSLSITKETGLPPWKVELPRNSLFDVGILEPGISRNQELNREEIRSRCLSFILSELFPNTTKIPHSSGIGTISDLDENKQFPSKICPTAGNRAQTLFEQSIVKANHVCNNSRNLEDRWIGDLCDISH